MSDDWMKEDEHLLPLKDTRTKRQKAKDNGANPFDTVYIPLRFPDGTTGNMCVLRSALEKPLKEHRA